MNGDNIFFAGSRDVETRMAVRPPRGFSGGSQPETGWNVLDYEVNAQKAETLGTLGRQVEQALAALQSFEDGCPDSGGEDRRSHLLDRAADRVWTFMIQRELSGLRNWDSVVKEYGIPREVLNRLGQAGRNRG